MFGPDCHAIRPSAVRARPGRPFVWPGVGRPQPGERWRTAMAAELANKVKARVSSGVKDWLSR